MRTIQDLRIQTFQIVQLYHRQKCDAATIARELACTPARVASALASYARMPVGLEKIEGFLNHNGVEFGPLQEDRFVGSDVVVDLLAHRRLSL
jgi:hypothetical protein